MKAKVSAIIIILIMVGAAGLSAKSALFSLLTDMFDQQSIKAQEPGSMQNFPVGTVSVDGRVNNDPDDRFSWLNKAYFSQNTTQNPISPTKKSLANGKQKYDTYCKVCHGDRSVFNPEGFADTPVNKRGMIAPALPQVTPEFTDGYIFSKARHGGAVMPALGYAATVTDRWDIVNYIRLLEK